MCRYFMDFTTDYKYRWHTIPAEQMLRTPLVERSLQRKLQVL